MSHSSLHTLLSTKSHISLIAHKSPDGDAYGSLEGLRCLLVDNYPGIEVSVVVPTEKEIDSRASWILGTTLSTLPIESDLTIVLDTSILSRTALDPADYPTNEIICIDHHELSPESLSGYIDPGAPSVTTILTEIAQELHWSLSPGVATALLLGIYTDTGGFMHANSSQRAFEAAAYLMARGADQGQITKRVFSSYSLPYLHDLGLGLQSIALVGSVGCIILPDGVDIFLKNHIVSFLSSVEHVDIACVLVQKGQIVKGSLRTRSDVVDVNEIAAHLGGGGHQKAAGFELKNARIEDGLLHWNDDIFSAEEFAKYLISL